MVVGWAVPLLSTPPTLECKSQQSSTTRSTVMKNQSYLVPELLVAHEKCVLPFTVENEHAREHAALNKYPSEHFRSSFVLTAVCGSVRVVSVQYVKDCSTTTPFVLLKLYSISLQSVMTFRVANRKPMSTQLTVAPYTSSSLKQTPIVSDVSST